MKPQRQRWGVAALLFMAYGANASQPPDPLAALLACRDLAETAARLACFDRESEVLAHAAVAHPLAPEKTFGLPPMEVNAMESTAAKRAEIQETESRLASLGALADGRLVFTLDNGQVWRQLSPGSELLLKTGDVVKLSRGALQSYWLQAPSGRNCKVTRVR